MLMSTATSYHESNAELRRELCQASEMWQRRVEQAGGHDFEPSDLMAASYAYTLAAVLGIAEKEFGPEVARTLASWADEMLTNGDFESHNADVWPGTTP